MKLNEKETWEYIRLELPIIKGELQQANNKINTLIQVLGLYSTLIFGLFIFCLTRYNDGILYRIATYIFLVLFIVLLFKLIFAARILKPIAEITEIKNNKKGRISIYRFFDISKITFKEFKSYFEISNRQEEPLYQIYINSIIANKRYDYAKRIMSLSFKIKM